MEDNIFRCKTNDAYVIKTLIELLHHAIKIACFQITPSGIYLRMMNSNQNLLIDCNLKAENFQLFFFSTHIENQCINVGINLSHFYRMLKSIKKRDNLVLFIQEQNPHEIGIEIIPKDLSRKTISMIKIQNIENLQIELPARYENSLLVSSSEFCKMCKDLIPISSTIRVRAKKYYIGFYSDVHAIFSREVLLGNHQEKLNMSDDAKDVYIYDEIFETEHISRILKIAGLAQNVNLIYKQDSPFHIQSRIGTVGDISLFLKSKNQIESEGNIY
jgi:proliferating cell nuclear antigen PCNA